MPVPDGYHVERRTPVGLIAVGAVTFGAGYAVALATGASSGFEHGETWLAVPVVGPWGALGSDRPSPCDLDVGSIDTADLTATQGEVEDCVKDALREAARLALIAADGVVQAFGAGLLLAGIAGGRSELVRDDLSPPRGRSMPYAQRRSRTSLGLSVDPLGRRGLLLGITGRF